MGTHEWIGLTAEYLYEKFDRDEEFAAGAKEVKTHRVPLGINFFHPTGLSVGLKGTYYGQDGEFERTDSPSGVFTDGDDYFWLVDAAISYRLPKRYGIITVGATNLFDESFDYFDTDLNNSSIQPDRFFFGTITLELP